MFNICGAIPRASRIIFLKSGSSGLATTGELLGVCCILEKCCNKTAPHQMTAIYNSQFSEAEYKVTVLPGGSKLSLIEWCPHHVGEQEVTSN